MERWFMASLAGALQHGAVAAVEFVASEYRDLACACESERTANAWAFAMLREAAMYTVTIAMWRRDSEALAVAAREYKFWAQDAASWAEVLADIWS